MNAKLIRMLDFYVVLPEPAKVRRQGGTMAAERDDIEREVSLSDLVRGLWGSRGWAVGGALLGFGIALLIALGAFLAAPGADVYRQEVVFTLTGQSEGRYPNGTAFSPNDLRSSAVLLRAHEESGLAEYGVSYAEFASAVTVTPTSALYEGTVERFRDRLSSRNLTFEERRQIEEEFAAALESRLADNAIVALTLPRSRNVPQAVGRRAVIAIPNIWADIYINQLGVVDLPVAVSTGELISAEFVAGLDYPLAYDALVGAAGELRRRVDAIQRLSGAQNLAEASSGRTLYDVERDVMRIERFSLRQVLAPLAELGVSRTPELTTVAYRYQIEKLEEDIRLATSSARNIEGVLRVGERAEANGPAPAAGEVATATGFGVPIAAQPPLPADFLERLVSMTVENAGVAFRETMLEYKLRLENEALVATLQRDMLANRVAAIADVSGAPVAGRGGTQYEEVFARESEAVVGQLNLLWRQVDLILAQANLQRLNFDKQLFKPMPTANAVISQSPLLSRNTAVFVLGAGMIGLVGGMLLHFARRALRAGRIERAR